MITPVWFSGCSLDTLSPPAMLLVGGFLFQSPRASRTTWVGHHARFPSRWGRGNLPSRIRFQRLEADHPVTASTLPVPYLPGISSGIDGVRTLACPERRFFDSEAGRAVQASAADLMMTGINHPSERQ